MLRRTTEAQQEACRREREEKATANVAKTQQDDAATKRARLTKLWHVDSPDPVKEAGHHLYHLILPGRKLELRERAKRL